MTYMYLAPTNMLWSKSLFAFFVSILVFDVNNGQTSWPVSASDFMHWTAAMTVWLDICMID